MKKDTNQKTAHCSCAKCNAADFHKETENVSGNSVSRLFIVRMAAGCVLYVCGLMFEQGHPAALAAIVANIAGAAFNPGALALPCFLAAWICFGGDVLARSCRNILRGEIFDENFLMSIATIGAFAIGEYPEAAAVMLFYQVGEYFQDRAVQKSRRSIRALLDIRPVSANLVVGEGKSAEIRAVPPADVRVGDVIVVRCGERVPLDGIVLEGNSLLDFSVLTGESMPVEIFPGKPVMSGAINQTALITVRVEKPEGESAIARILRLVENAYEKKAYVENFITKFARYYTPAVVFAALILALAPPLVLTLTPLGRAVSGGFNLPFMTLLGEWGYRALIFLVVSCPCALVISVPLSFFAGLGCASRNGILIKGSNYVEALAKTGVVVFDKTGTLTRGVFKVTGIIPAPGVSADDLLFYTANAEAFSTHPAAVSICKRAEALVDKNLAASVRETAGQGVSALVNGKQVAAGNEKWVAGTIAGGKKNFPAVSTTATVVHASIDGHYAGCFEIADELKQDAREVCPALKTLGVRKIAMFTGDNAAAGMSVARELGIDDARCELLPEDKLTELEKLDAQKTPGASLVFVGDGINDAPVLARAGVGIAMGDMGSDAAIEAADVVLMSGEPSRIARAIRICRKTHGIVMQNIVFALAVKGVILVAGALGLTSIWMAVFGDVGVALLAVLNAMRAGRY
ncbi:MAG: heavy metal translocating P-type ATPase [Spirochaetaceae bacterium]|jgi:Cd2+/Zn2+-exporting ATPase|nr:heavy metal translocating P-type ATPase [Spirochaetaceae bacterium]